MSTSIPSGGQEALLRRALRKLEETESKLRTLERGQREPIAIIGMSCRFPGGATSPEAFRELLASGRDAVRDVPVERWDAEALHDPDPDAQGALTARKGCFIDQPDQFDAAFFGISPREAARMDPQQRLLLEVSWEALERAGVAPDSLMGSATGVMVGVASHDYFEMSTGAPESIDAYTGSGTALSVAAGRLSYVLGLRGPALSVDTACSSSLVAVHLACQSLRLGECNLALAGGVSLMLAPILAMIESRTRMLAPDGRCKTFDASADGVVRGEGCGVVVLERLSDAQRAGHRILAVIRGSAVNQDGRSAGLTVPNGSAQEAVIRRALEQADLAPKQVGFVEAHGTGTSLGDPIEVEALGAVLSKERAPETPLLIGSVKPNIGHLEAAAGIAGLMKLVLSLEDGTLPPHLHFTTPNPRIAWDSLGVRVVTEPTPWPLIDGRRIGGVSSFGFSGTNAHVIVEQAPAREEQPTAPEPPWSLLTLSGATPEALEAQVDQYQRHLARHPELPLGDVAATANSGRTHFRHRAAFIARSTEELTSQLQRGESVIRGVIPDEPPRIAFLFSGQGAQYAGMGKELFASEPRFREALERCDAVLASRLERSLLSVLFDEDAASTPLSRTAYAQPALFALQYALVELWKSFGIEPAAVLGHSVGELAAACAAGVFSLEDGLTLVSERGRIMQSLMDEGHMAAIFAEGTGSRLLDVSHAFHSPLMEPMLQGLGAVAARLRTTDPRVTFISSVTGRAMGSEVTRPDHWVGHVRSPVRFADGMRALRSTGCEVFLEVGPGSALLDLAKGNLPDDGGLYLPSLMKGSSDSRGLLETLARLHVRGAPVRWAALEARGARSRITLPTYPFERRRYWLKEETFQFRSGRTPASSAATTTHPLLGHRLHSPVQGPEDAHFEAHLGPASPPLLGQHRVFGRAVVPATAFIELALAAGQRTLGEGALRVEALELSQPLLLPEEGTIVVHTVLAPEGPGRRGVRIFSRAEGAWRLHVTCKVRREDSRRPEATVVVPPAREALLSVESHYQRTREHGLALGPLFRSIQSLWRTERGGGAHVVLPNRAGNYVLHPALLDACLQALSVGFGDAVEGEAWLPVGLERLTVHESPREAAFCETQERPSLGKGRLQVDACLRAEDGRVLVVVEGLELRLARREAFLGGQPASDWLYTVDWPLAPQVDAEADFIPAPRILGDAVREGLGSIIPEDDVTRYTAVLGRLEAASLGYILAALHRLGAGFEPGQRFSTRELAERLRVAPPHQRLLGRLLAILSEEGILERTNEGWHVLQELPHARAERLLTAEEDSSSTRAQLAMLERCGMELAAVLRGERDALDLLFPDGNPDAVAELYRGTPVIRMMNTVAQQVVTRALAGAPPERRLRILEVGAGTGETTAWVLPRLPAERSDYLFTDVSAFFTERAAERFTDFPFVRYEVLDVERTPVGKERFDLVLASNVVHATRDARRTLRNLRELLAPGGTLVLLEGTVALRWVDLTFGLTDGWWRFEDTALRTDCPLLPPARWCEVLEEEGFAHADIASPSDTLPPLLGQQAVIVAQTPRTPKETRAAGAWLILADRGGVGQALAHQLQAQGGECFLVHETGSDIDPRSAASLALFQAKVANVRGVIHLWALDGASAAHLSTQQLREASKAGCGSVLQCVQALTQGTQSPPPPLTLITRGAQPAGGAVPGVAQSTLWGLARVIAREHPELRCRIIDLEDAPTSSEPEALLDAVLDPSDEQEFALRGAERRVARLVRAGQLAPTHSVSIRPDATYLITGGLGGLGLLTARWLVERGARHLALLSRRPPGPEARTAMAELTARGATVLGLPCDVSREESLTQALAELERRLPPLRGVFHSAGVLEDGVLSGLSWERFATVLAPKVDGAWNLHVLTRTKPLDLFVIYGSATSLLGAWGQANHTAANTFLDALAHHRQALGLPCTCIAWGAWEGVGAANRAEAGTRMGELGMSTISPERGLELLERILASGAAQLGVMPIVWSEFARKVGASPYLSRLLAETKAEPEQPAREGLLARLQVASVHERRVLLDEHVRSQLARVLGMSSLDSVGGDHRLFDLGMDSLTAVELKNRLSTSLERPLRSTLVFDFPRIDALVEHLGRDVLGVLPPPEPVAAPHLPPSSPPPPIPHAQEIQGMSDQELEALITHEFQLVSR
ncbi:type I polyketide synthase [Myxococcus sp. CA040A]|uniref:type I polyketide synthase n=1 Tax=Myxococcus sp. CA040A TaxID=2741738 RepID=UPI00157B4941|nr:type I polyketide synthase [Myxococcus sp. CA040A]NTX01461.1 SDR family NAD(P)-dependent oxidoreductase [Myxococcus sp. CA040A]